MFGLHYDELALQLKGAEKQSEIHRLKAQVARAAMDRLENGELSKAEEKKLKSEISAYCSDVQLGAMDLWYGYSVVTWGRLLLRGDDWKETRTVLMSQAEVLENIEKNLAANKIPVSSISPLAGCRYILGETYRMEYESTDELKPAVEALKHYYNVYIKYGDSPWGPPAQGKTEIVTEFLESRGRHVRVELGKHRATFIKGKFSSGARLTAEGRYEDALEQYLDALNIHPESTKSSEALRNIGTCYLNLGKNDETLATAEYLCERFAGSTNASTAVLAIGRQYLDAGMADTGEQVFDLYLSAFPEDLYRADILSYLAWEAYNAEDRSEAVVRFARLEAELRKRGECGAVLEKTVYIQAVESGECSRMNAFTQEFPESELVPSVLGKKAEALLVDGCFDEAFETLEELGRRYPESKASRSALAGLITAAVKEQHFELADRVLDRMLEDRSAYGPEVYISTGEGLLSSGQFRMAGKAFSSVESSAKRTFAERALYGLSRCCFGAGEYDKCLATLDQLFTQFPDSGFFYDFRLMQARALVLLDRKQEAVGCYAEVLAAGAESSVRFEMAGILESPEDRLATYQRIVLLGDTNADGVVMAKSIVASLPLCLELGKYQLAVENCEQFEKHFPQHEQHSTVTAFRKEASDALAL